MKRATHTISSGFFLLFIVLFALSVRGYGQETALDRYLAKPDAAYAWKLVGTINPEGCRGFVLELTSQTWRSASEVDRPVWKHWLTIVKPDQVSTNKALLFIGGGNNRTPAPEKISERAASIARDTNSVVAELGMVPNQPLHFSDSQEKARSEDDLIAYTRVKHFSFFDEGRFLACSPGDGQERSARDGCNPGIYGRRGSRKDKN